MCTISVVVVSYNNDAYIAQTLESVLSQSFTDWECIVVDNGSTDSTPLIEADYAQKHKRLVAWRKPNEGPSAGRNYGYQKMVVAQSALLVYSSYGHSNTHLPSL